MLGVVYDVPVCKDDPPDKAVYQSTTPAEAVAPKVTVPVPQRAAGVVLAIVGVVLTVAMTAVLDGEIHPLLFTST